MFSDPQSVTIAGTPVSLPRVGVGPSNATYAAADGNTVMTIQHSNGKRNRRSTRVQFRKIAADPLLDGVSREYTMSVNYVIDHPTVGFSNTEVETNAKAGLDKLATAGTLTKIIGGES